jgi:hypothetical protein
LFARIINGRKVIKEKNIPRIERIVECGKTIWFITGERILLNHSESPRSGFISGVDSFLEDQDIRIIREVNGGGERSRCVV